MMDMCPASMQWATSHEKQFPGLGCDGGKWIYFIVTQSFVPVW